MIEQRLLIKVGSLKRPFLSILMPVCFLGCSDTSVVYDNVSFYPYEETSHGQYFNESKVTYASTFTYLSSQDASFEVSQECASHSKSCDSIKTVSFRVPEASGLYWVSYTSGENEYTRPISVINQTEEKQACLVVNTFTWQGYSDVGGINYYRPPYDAPVTVSLNRPVKANAASPHGYSFPIYRLLKKVVGEVYSIDDRFIHENAGWVAENCEYLVFSQHAEYWTQSAFDQLVDFIKSGGQALNFSSNIAYWKVSYQDQSITVDKRKEVLKENRFAFFRPEIKSLFGMYYQGYPLKRYAKDEEAFSARYPLLSGLPEMDYSKLRKVDVLQGEHEVFKCIDQKGIDMLGDEFLGVELDGIVVKRYRTGESEPLVLSSETSVKGGLMVGWSVYGGDIRRLVFARDYNPGDQGRVISFGSIGWARHTRDNVDIRNITLQAISAISGVEYPCDK